jgi:parallel beta-helix repeat protein
MLTLLLLCSALFVINTKIGKSQYSGSIFIRSDGSVDPSTAPIQRVGNVYTLADKVDGNITVQKDNIMIDGAGYTIQGSALNLSAISTATIGIDIQNRVNVTIKNVQIKSFVNGIHLLNSSENNIIGNNITENVDGIRLDSSSNNIIVGNNITLNLHGIHPFTNNKFYHNNFVNNTQQVFIGPPDAFNSWDDDYPLGGNYWSNYTGVDLKNGAGQNLNGSDGIGDTPFVIDANNTDRYPLVAPFHEQAQPDQTFLYVAVGFVGVFVIVTIGILLLTKKAKRKIKKENNR